MKDTHRSTPSKKGHINFSQMFDEQAKQVENNSHIQGLLSPNKANTIENKIDTKLDHIEDLIKSMTPNVPELGPAEVKTIKIDNTPKRIYFYSAAIILAGLFIGVGLTLNNPTPTKVVFEPIGQIQQSDKMWVLTKYGNLRSAPSSKGSIITTLAPHLQVKELSASKGWIKVEFNDLLKNKVFIGWLYKPVLKLVK